MRWIAWCLMFLIALGWLASEIPLPEATGAAAERLDCWRRTQDGWQWAWWLTPHIPVRRPALHPAAVGLLEALVSIAALVAFPLRSRPVAVAHTGPGGPHQQGPGHARRRPPKIAQR